MSTGDGTEASAHVGSAETSGDDRSAIEAGGEPKTLNAFDPQGVTWRSTRTPRAIRPGETLSPNPQIGPQLQYNPSNP